MNLHPSKSIAFFDVDHTLVKCNSGYYTSLELVRQGILKKRRVLQAIYYSMASVFFQQDIKKIYQIAADDMAGTTLARALEIGALCLERDVKPRFYAEGLRVLEKHKKCGDQVVLLTSAPYMLIRNLQDYLGIEEAYCMGPEIVDGVLTNRVQLPICHAEGKVHYAELSAKKHGVPLAQCYFYTDHESDLPLLEKVGKPRVVNPSRRLAALAQSHKWPVLKFERTSAA